MLPVVIGTPVYARSLSGKHRLNKLGTFIPCEGAEQPWLEMIFIAYHLTAASQSLMEVQHPEFGRCLVFESFCKMSHKAEGRKLALKQVVEKIRFKSGSYHYPQGVILQSEAEVTNNGEEHYKFNYYSFSKTV